MGAACTLQSVTIKWEERFLSFGILVNTLGSTKGKVSCVNTGAESKAELQERKEQNKVRKEPDFRLR